MNCTIWRSTSISAPFSASSANAIVEAVIVYPLWIRVVGSHLNLIRTHDGHPLRAADLKDLHHLLGHHLYDTP